MNNIKDSDIVFVTTSLMTKWLTYQSKIIKNMFPGSEHIIIDGSSPDFRRDWGTNWYKWISTVEKSQAKFYIHIDEDFFILNKNEILKAIIKMEKDNINLLGCSDGYHYYRSHNPLAINPFFMIGRVADLIHINISNIKVHKKPNAWVNNLDIKFNNKWINDFKYPHKIMRESKFSHFEPYYALFWKMRELNMKIDYLYPHFDDRFSSTNPRITEKSEDIGIHMWYTRQWSKNEHIKRYTLLEKYLNDNNLI